MGTNYAPLLADLFLHPFEYDFVLNSMKQDMTKAIPLSNTFPYTDDLFSVNNEEFGDNINEQLLDEVEHDIMNHQNRGLCYLPKPKAEADNTDTRF